MKKWKTNRDDEEYEYCPVSHKRIYYTRGAAFKAAQQIERKHKGHASVYRCDHCCHFHLTSGSYETSKIQRQPKIARRFQGVLYE